MKTRDIIEHLEKYEELIDDVDFLSIEVSNVGYRYMKIHCSHLNKTHLFKHYADEATIENTGAYIRVSLDIEGVEYFMLVDNEEQANSILKGE